MSVFDNDRQAENFIKRLTETIVWCSTQVSLEDPENSLRSCKPDYFHLTSRSSQVFSVANERSNRLLRAGLKNLPSVADLREGRLLAFDPDLTLSDGAARVASQGYFDVHNIPPFDTWVWYVYEEAYARRLLDRPEPDGQFFESYLVAWVPPQFRKLADAGIKVIPEECVIWLDALNTSFSKALRRRKLIT